MPNKVTISLGEIVTQIDQATARLAAAQGKALTKVEKQKLAVKIKNLKKIKISVKKNCPKGKSGLTIVVPTL
jgi:hypothetical protein